jgi:PAS domain S-box-containing protein
MNERKLPRTMWLALGLVIISGTALAWLELYQATDGASALQRSRSQVLQAFEVMGTAQSLYQEVQAAQRALRLVVSTGERKELDAFRASSRRANDLLATLKQLTHQQVEHRARVAELELLIESWLAELARIARLSQEADGAKSAQKIMQTPAPLDAMRAIGGLVDDTIAAEKTLLTARLIEAAEDERYVRQQALASALLALAFMVLGVALTALAFQRVKASEQAYRESEENLRLFTAGVIDYAICMLDLEGVVTSWNAGAERIKGYAADEIIGRHFSRFYTEEDRRAGLAEQALKTAAQEGKYETEAWRVRKDGSRFMANVVIDPLRDRYGRLYGYAKITRDVTERVAQQQALEHARAALAQSQKMEALGQLSGGIAHDFNNFLHVIRNAVELLERRLKGGQPELDRLLDMVKRNVDRATSLTQRLLAFSRRQPLEPKPLSPNRLILGVADLLRQTLGESVAIETVLGGGVWTVAADANQLETAILNLALNARHAMPQGGKLTIETANTRLDEAYASAEEALVPGQYVLIAVSDTGTGMTPEVREKAFDPFFTTKETGRGTGLGLSQVYGFIKQSGGHAKIYSEPGEGTTVKLYLPRLTGTESAEPPPKTRPAPAGSAMETVLLVEDDEDVRSFSAEVLSDLGYRVLVASDARTALRVLEEEPGVRLLFTDVGLPDGMNGRQLADEARRRWPALKVLFTTAYARNAIIHHGRLDPGVELIVKPFSQAELASRVRGLLDRGVEAAPGAC